MRGSWQIIKKDIKLLVSDRRALVLLITLPMVFIAIIGFSTGELLSWQDDNQLLRVAVLNQDRGNLSEAVTDSLKKRQGVKVETIIAREDAERMIDRGEITVALLIGPEFSDRVEELRIQDILATAEGKLAEGLPGLDMEVLTRNELANTGSMVSWLVFSDTIQAIVPHVAGKNRLLARFLPKDVDPDAAEVAFPKQEVTLTETTPSGGNPMYQTIVPSYTVMFVFFLINIMARSVINERDLGTLRRLQTAPIRPVNLLIGKTAPFLLISVVQTATLFLFGRFLFGMSWGNAPGLLIPVILCTSLAATALGLLVATIVRTDSQVSAVGTFLVITLAAMSGCILPRAWLPDAMQQASLATPHAWALIAYDEILAHRFVDATIVYECCALLLMFALLFFIVGCWRFNPAD